jgi:hypothetical protein
VELRQGISRPSKQDDIRRRQSKSDFVPVQWRYDITAAITPRGTRKWPEAPLEAAPIKSKGAAEMHKGMMDHGLDRSNAKKKKKKPEEDPGAFSEEAKGKDAEKGLFHMR